MHLTTRKTFTILLFLGIFVMALRPIADPDFWWHLRTGELIADTGTIPTSDPFSFTAFEKPWIAHEWLTELAIFRVFELGGLPLLLVIFSIIITGSYLITFLNTDQNARPYAAGFAILLGSIASAPTWGVRPQILTLLFTAIFLLLLNRYHLNHDWKNLLPLPFLSVLWVNLHAGYFIGFGLIAIYLIGETITALFHRAEYPLSLKSPVIAYLIALLLSIAAAILNPNHYRILIYPFQTLTSDSMMLFIQEWFSPDFHQIEWQPLALLFLALIAFPLSTKKSTSITNILLLVVFGYAALRSMRHVPLFSLVAIPVLADQISALLRIKQTTVTLNRPVKIVNLILISFLLIASVSQIFVVIQEQSSSDENATPRRAVEWIEANRPAGNIFNTYQWGGYLIWRLYPDYQVFIDGRADLYGDEFIYDYMDISHLRPGWSEALDSYAVNLVLIQPGEPLAEALAAFSGWTMAYEDETSMIFIRK